MNKGRDPLERIANALERLAPSAPPATNWLSAPAYVWEGSGAREVGDLTALPLSLLRGIDDQKTRVHDNVARLATGSAAHDMLLWGARGMGKSALLRAAVKQVQDGAPGALGLVQIAPDALDTLPRLFESLSAAERKFVIFIDDLGFADNDAVGPRRLRSWLEGGVEARSSNCRLAVTANRRAILARQASEQDPDSGDAALNPRDAVDDKLALADRFGLSVGFHPCDQSDYLKIVRGYTDPLGLDFTDADALEWASRRGQRSGRTALQFVVELAGRAGIAL